MEFPPPHKIVYECLNDRETQSYWLAYKQTYAHQCDFEEIDAAVMNSMEDFAKWITQWMSFAPSQAHIRFRVLMVWHAHFLSLACQQMLRRSLEQRSFRCRVWFHIEEPLLQSAIISRCIVKCLPSYSHIPKIVGPPLDVSLWLDPRSAECKNESSTKQQVSSNANIH
jgi:hypothetical protein